MDNTFNTLEEIQATFGTSLFGDDQITLRSEQRFWLSMDGRIKVFTVFVECKDAFW